MRILIAENHFGSREGLAALLTEEGYDVHAACDGATALATAARRHPDVLIADYDLDDMTGAELAARMRDVLPSCRVIAVSGWTKLCRDDDAPSLRCATEGLRWLALPFFPKPIDFEALLRELARVPCAARASF